MVIQSLVEFTHSGFQFKNVKYAHNLEQKQLKNCREYISSIHTPMFFYAFCNVENITTKLLFLYALVFSTPRLIRGAYW